MRSGGWQDYLCVERGQPGETACGGGLDGVSVEVAPATFVELRLLCLLRSSGLLDVFNAAAAVAASAVHTSNIVAGGSSDAVLLVHRFIHNRLNLLLQILNLRRICNHHLLCEVLSEQTRFDSIFDIHLSIDYQLLLKEAVCILQFPNLSVEIRDSESISSVELFASRGWHAEPIGRTHRRFRLSLCGYALRFDSLFVACCARCLLATLPTRTYVFIEPGAYVRFRERGIDSSTVRSSPGYCRRPSESLVTLQLGS